jgi:hypothetical protein
MEKRAPCLRCTHEGDEIRGSIGWGEYLLAHEKYVRFCQQKHRKTRRFRCFTPERLAELGGLGYDAVTSFLGHEPTTWRQEPIKVADE